MTDGVQGRTENPRKAFTELKPEVLLKQAGRVWPFRLCLAASSACRTPSSSHPTSARKGTLPTLTHRISRRSPAPGAGTGSVTRA
jgi:hypothetical protein